MENTQCGDERQIGSNCLSSATARHPSTDHTLHLLHYEADQLCVWKPGKQQLDLLRIQYTYVSTEGPAYREHFGAKEHNYSHWLRLNHTAGWMDLARFLFMNPEAASPAKSYSIAFAVMAELSIGTSSG